MGRLDLSKFQQGLVILSLETVVDHLRLNLSSEMAFFGPSSSSQFLRPPPAPSRKKNYVLHDEVDDFLLLFFFQREFTFLESRITRNQLILAGRSLLDPQVSTNSGLLSVFAQDVRTTPPTQNTFNVLQEPANAVRYL